MSLRTLPAKELKRFINFYEQTLIELMAYFEKKEISFTSLECYRNYTKCRFLFEVLYVGYSYKLQIDSIESRIMGETSHVKLQYWFKDGVYFCENRRYKKEHAIVEKDRFDDMEKF
jgi:hypothetical protein